MTDDPYALPADPLEIPGFLRRDNNESPISAIGQNGPKYTMPVVTEVSLDELKVIADRIRGRLRRTAAEVIETGRDLLIAKAKLKHGDFKKWLGDEFAMSDRTALNYMRLAKLAEGKNEIISDLPLTTLYALSAPSAPEKIKNEVFTDLAEGRPVDHRKLEARLKSRPHGSAGRTRVSRVVTAKSANLGEGAQLAEWLRTKLSSSDFAYFCDLLTRSAIDQFVEEIARLSDGKVGFRQVHADGTA